MNHFSAVALSKMISKSLTCNLHDKLSVKVSTSNPVISISESFGLDLSSLIISEALYVPSSGMSLRISIICLCIGSRQLCEKKSAIPTTRVLLAGSRITASLLTVF